MYFGRVVVAPVGYADVALKALAKTDRETRKVPTLQAIQ